jgi:hypothetical protein
MHANQPVTNYQFVLKFAIHQTLEDSAGSVFQLPYYPASGVIRGVYEEDT